MNSTCWQRCSHLVGSCFSITHTEQTVAFTQAFSKGSSVFSAINTNTFKAVLKIFLEHEQPVCASNSIFSCTN